jgi:hypothetical protein
MWDTENLLIHLDVDYQNASAPGLAFVSLRGVLQMEPTYRAVR